MRRSYLYRGTFVFAFSLLYFCSEGLKAQTHSNDFGQAEPPQPPIMPSIFIGAEGGWMKNMQSGNFKLDCECESQDGKGNSGIGSLFIEYTISPYFSTGMKVGVDVKSTTSITNVTDSATIVISANDSVAQGSLPITRTVNISATYFFISPFFKLSPFGRGAFIQIAPELGILTSSNLTNKSNLQNSSVRLSNGDIVTNVRFANGTQEETLQDEKIRDAKSTRIGLFLTAGYDLPVFGNFLLSPQVSYNLALTDIASGTDAGNWKISSFVVTLGLKYGI